MLCKVQDWEKLTNALILQNIIYLVMSPEVGSFLLSINFLVWCNANPRSRIDRYFLCFAQYSSSSTLRILLRLIFLIRMTFFFFSLSAVPLADIGRIYIKTRKPNGFWHSWNVSHIIANESWYTFTLQHNFHYNVIAITLSYDL